MTTKQITESTKEARATAIEIFNARLDRKIAAREAARKARAARQVLASVIK